MFNKIIICSKLILFMGLKTKLRIKIKKISRFSENFSQKFDFTANGLHRDHPPAWNLIYQN